LAAVAHAFEALDSRRLIKCELITGRAANLNAEALYDNTAEVRVAASGAIVMMEKESDMLLLKRAIAAEKDSDVRPSMGTDLKRLRI
jgi:hypothetical protein